MGQLFSNLKQFFDNITCHDSCLSSCCTKTVIIEEIIDDAHHHSHCHSNQQNQPHHLIKEKNVS
jgi:hypothetical protein